MQASSPEQLPGLLSLTALLPTLSVTSTWPSVAFPAARPTNSGVGIQVQLRHQRYGSCHAEFSMEEKQPNPLPTFGALGTTVCGAGEDLPLPSGHPILRTFESFPGGSCWAAGCLPENHNSPMATLCFPSAQQRRHNGAEAKEVLLEGCLRAAGMSPLCPWLGRER